MATVRALISEATAILLRLICSNVPPPYYESISVCKATDPMLVAEQAAKREDMNMLFLIYCDHRCSSGNILHDADSVCDVPCDGFT